MNLFVLDRDTRRPKRGASSASSFDHRPTRQQHIARAPPQRHERRGIGGADPAPVVIGQSRLRNDSITWSVADAEIRDSWTREAESPAGIGPREAEPFYGAIIGARFCSTPPTARKGGPSLCCTAQAIEVFPFPDGTVRRMPSIMNYHTA